MAKRRVHKNQQSRTANKAVNRDRDKGSRRQTGISGRRKRNMDASVMVESATDPQRLRPKRADGEIYLEVECGTNKAKLFLSKLCQGSKGACILFNESWLTPNEFQFVSGRCAVKDWKRSIRHNGHCLKVLLSEAEHLTQLQSNSTPRTSGKDEIRASEETMKISSQNSEMGIKDSRKVCISVLFSSHAYMLIIMKSIWWLLIKGQGKVQGVPHHKPPPFPDTKRKRKQTKPNKRKSNKCTKISALFPKRGIAMLKGLKNTRIK